MSNSSSGPFSRREVLSSAAAGLALSAGAAIAAGEEKSKTPFKATAGRINHSVCNWCFHPMELETLARGAAALGIKSVELVGPADWPTLKKYGLICAMTPSHGLDRGLNHKEHHAECLEKLTTAIEATSAAGWPNVITFSGMRQKISDADGIRNTVEGLKKIMPLAEKSRVTVCIEVLNSRVDIEMKGHPDYQCDTVEWAAEVCKQIGSPRMKMLFDIYHVQIMQGDVITRIRQFKEYIGHYHTAGVPGRNEIDDSQELNYPPIMRAIVESGFKQYVAQEFIPTGSDKLAALEQAIRLCDV